MAEPSSAPRSPRVDPIQILMEASEVAAGHPLDLDDLLRALSDLVRKVVDYQLFAVLLADGQGTLTIRYSIGYRPELMRHLRVRLGEGITGDAAVRRKSVLVNDVTNDPRYLAAIDAVRSELAVPLVARGELVGVIDLQSSELNAFDDSERNVLELIASRFSLAIEAAKLHDETARQNETLKTLAEIAQEFSTILRLEDLLNKLSSLVRKLIHYDAFSIYLLERDSASLRHYFGVRFDQRVQWQSIPLSGGLVGHAARNREIVLVADTTKDPRYIASVEGIRSEAAVPLLIKDAVIGVLDLESEKAGAFTQEDVRMLSLLAPQVAAAIENARLYEQVERHREKLHQDLQAARQLQKSLLLGAFPDVAGLEIKARNVPAAQISGDLYDCYSLPGGDVAIICADVSGKGAAAALFAAMTVGLMRHVAPQHRDPSELLEAVNQELLARRVETRYVTAICAIWRPGSRTLAVASAGQPRPIVRLRGKAETLQIGGTPLGLVDPGVYDQVSLELSPGDVFLSASDGLHETLDTAGKEYGERRFLETLESHPEARPDELLDIIFEDARRFSGRDLPADDRTIVVLRAK